jgi:exoribonuclease R
MSARAYLEQIYGQAPRAEDAPAHAIEGILHTKNYVDFTIYSNDGRELHSFTGAKRANRCLPGDHVWWSGERCELELRDEHPLIVGTIELASPSRYGMTRKKVPMYLFTPYDRKYPHFIVGCSERDLARNIIALVKLDDWSDAAPFPRGLLEQRLGYSGEFEAEKKALEWQACPWKYPKHTYIPEWSSNEETCPLDGYTFHIDPIGCRDVDDVITLKQINDREWRMTITISDVAGYVEDGSAIDILASLIGQTLYSTDGQVIRPMLPAEYSEGACSLLPGKQSHGISLQCKWNGEALEEPTWLLTTFETERSYHYEECVEDETTPYFRVLREVSSYLAKEPTMDSHQWIEQLMLYYNTEAGKVLKQLSSGILRRHPSADEERLRTYEEHLPECKHLAMSAAEYCLAEEKETWHAGIHTDHYAHASSPIRRYADLVNQRVLKQWIIGQQNTPYIVPVPMVDLNERSHAIRRYARDMDYVTALETGITQFQAFIMDKTPMEDGQIKIRMYVPTWKRMVSSTYKKGTIPDTIYSRDETYEVFVPLYKSVMITCTYNVAQRNWKDRVIMRLDPLPSAASD